MNTEEIDTDEPTEKVHTFSDFLTNAVTCGLTSFSQLRALLHIAENPGLFKHELAAYLRIEETSTYPILGILQKAGLVETIKDERSRGKVWQTTDRGGEVYEFITAGTPLPEHEPADH